MSQRGGQRIGTRGQRKTGGVAASSSRVPVIRFRKSGSFFIGRIGSGSVALGDHYKPAADASRVNTRLEHAEPPRE